MRPLTQAERRLEDAAARMGTDNHNVNAIVERARQLLDPDNVKPTPCITRENNEHRTNTDADIH